MPTATRPRAAIFDLDGTVVDNMFLQAEAFAVFAARHGLPPLTPADRAKTDGRVGEFIDLVAVTPPKTAKSGKKSRDAQSRAQPTIIRARVAGPGRAVTTTDTSASQLRDGSQPTDELGNTSDARSAPDSSGTDAAPPSPSSPRGKQPGKRTIVLPLRPASDAPREDPRP